MKHPLITKAVAFAGIAFGALGMAQAAHARTDVFLTLGVPGPAYVAPQPVYSVPQVVYSDPEQVYVRPGYDDWRWRREQWRREEWRRQQWQREHWRHEQWEREQARHWHHDRDGDGRGWD